jgi:hypothetical protein
MRFVFLDGAEHRDGALGGGAAVEVDERAAIDRAVENRKFPPDALDVESGRLVDLRGGCSH